MLDHRSKTPPFRKLALAAGALALAVLAAEVAHRLWFYGPGGLSPARLASVKPIGETEYMIDAEWPLVAYRLKPGIDVWYKLHRFTTSTHGLRDREYDRGKPPDTFRIAVVGDSYTMGSGVGNEDTYHAVLEERLNAGSGGTTYELINFGVGGYSLLHELGVIEHIALDWDPDLILLAVTWNDASPPSVQYFRNLFPDHTGIAPLGNRPLPPPAPTSYWRLTMIDKYLKPEAPPPERPGVREGAVEVTRDELGIRAVLGLEAELSGEEEYIPVVFERMREVCAAAGVPVFCVHLSTGDTDYMRGFAEQFEPAARAAGFGFLDTSSLFSGVDRGDIIVMPNDGHPNARSHALYATALEDALRAGDWLSR